MPKKLERCVKKVSKKKGVNSAWAICVSSLKKRKGYKQKKK